MHTSLLKGFAPAVFLFAFPFCVFSQERLMPGFQVTDTATGVLCIEYCGSRYNRSHEKMEYVIIAVHLPAHLVKSIPELKKNGAYSSRNIKILSRQKEFLKKAGGEKVTLWYDRKRFRTVYPSGLKTGLIIRPEEYRRWQFLVMPPSLIPPSKRNWGDPPTRKRRSSYYMNLCLTAMQNPAPFTHLI